MTESNEANEISEERQRKYWELSGFYNHAKFMMDHHPDASPNEIINKFIDNQEFEASAWKQVADWEDEVWRHNHRLLRTIKKAKGRTFQKYLLQIIKDSGRVTDKMGIVKEPGGDWQNEPMGRTIKGYWVDQWSVGTEGDSWNGHVWVQLRENKYLKFSYSM